MNRSIHFTLEACAVSASSNTAKKAYYEECGLFSTFWHGRMCLRLPKGGKFRSPGHGFGSSSIRSPFAHDIVSLKILGHAALKLLYTWFPVKNLEKYETGVRTVENH